MQDGIENIVSINRVTRTPSFEEKRHSVAEKTDNRASEENQISKYPVDRIVDYVDTPTGPHFCVQCHGYTPSEDTAEPPCYIPQPFIEGYW